ncbi:tetraacyldisaccharide 4'-kinase [Inhella inkyongensis]|uniref:Tetraacyldisaccharide 4'-kinase n=1 Tax=Inhella inkyongensis TaxID=392593 RepID=A0A840S0Q5_9BURK|nr:tetraacyldisaccharide 4'-kinase [Inhella inkyongensis]MBB5203845.1 tetraacyldisaccharide 4'-kinase [Inhella inkyongensis]
MSAWLQRQWLRRGPLAWSLRPLTAVYRALQSWDRARHASGRRAIHRPPVPVLVVGNWIVGGAGKTPTLLAVLALLKAWGWRAGVVSRGYGRHSEGVQLAHAHSDAHQLGDEPLLIWRRSGAPLAVAASRGEACAALLAAHPDLNLIVSDDGLQHAGLARDLSLWLFDARGLGNGWLLPAGPLRQDRALPPLPGSRANHLVLYTDGQPSTALPGFVAQRQLAGAVSLDSWWNHQAQTPQALESLRGRRLVAVAGLARPQAFFDMLQAAGLDFQALPLPDHHRFDHLPWQADDELLLTEKDAVKLPPERLAPGQRAWVLPLDLQPEPAFAEALLHELQALLGPPPHGPTPDRTAGLPPVQGPAATQP